MNSNMNNKYDIYICYSRKDNEIATDICHFLDQQGLSYWIDRRNDSRIARCPLWKKENII